MLGAVARRDAMQCRMAPSHCIASHRMVWHGMAWHGMVSHHIRFSQRASPQNHGRPCFTSRHVTSRHALHCIESHAWMDWQCQWHGHRRFYYKYFPWLAEFGSGVPALLFYVPSLSGVETRCKTTISRFDSIHFVCFHSIPRLRFQYAP